MSACVQVHLCACACACAAAERAATLLLAADCCGAVWMWDMVRKVLGAGSMYGYVPSPCVIAEDLYWYEGQDQRPHPFPMMEVKCGERMMSRFVIDELKKF